MPLPLTPIDVHHLPEAVARVAGPSVPSQAKMMAARGLAPMGPRDLATALYQLALDADKQVSGAAAQTAEKLPDNILAAALADALDARVIEFYATRVVNKDPLIERILLNNYTHDETYVTLAGALKAERSLEILAGNQVRLLRHPAIIEAFYFNKRARMSTVNRLLELAVRNGLTLEKVPSFKELAASILGQAAEPQQDPAQPRAQPAALATGAPADAVTGSSLDDDQFSALLEEEWDEGPVGTLEYEDESEADERTRKMSTLTVNEKIRLATIGNIAHRMILIRDPNRSVALAAVKSPGISDQEAVRYAGDRGLAEEVIRHIADRRDWQKNYAIKVNLVNNPKCPLMHSMRLLGHMRPNDLRSIARSKNIPATLAQAAKKKLGQRSR